MTLREPSRVHRPTKDMLSAADAMARIPRRWCAVERAAREEVGTSAARRDARLMGACTLQWQKRENFVWIKRPDCIL